MNLCSKCFADFQKKQPDDDSTPSTSNSQSDLFSEETTSDNNNTSVTTPTLSPSQQSLPTELNVTSPSEEECGPCTDTAHVSLITPTKRSCGADSQSESEASPVKRPRLVENPERPEESGRSKQKSRRRCFQCQTKLELVQQELGSCRCGYVFCMLHRLPEQHDCTFDHMGRGREEAIMKMVKLTGKWGAPASASGRGAPEGQARPPHDAVLSSLMLALFRTKSARHLVLGTRQTTASRLLSLASHPGTVV